MISAAKLCGEIWAEDGDLSTELAQSVRPRGRLSLYETFAALSPEPGRLVRGIYRLLGKLRPAVYVLRRA